jgi:uncharacterized protein (TIGR00725 family)
MKGRLKMRRFVVGVMGAGEGAGAQALQEAFELGQAIAREGWVLLTGGRAAGVMQEASRGAKQIDGSLTIGILPNAQAQVSPFVDVAIVTDIGNGRNNINVLSSDVVVGCGVGGAGTISEIALALKNGKPVVLLKADRLSQQFFARLSSRQLFFVDSVEAVIRLIEEKFVTGNRGEMMDYESEC